jgi:hypothetical protein
VTAYAKGTVHAHSTNSYDGKLSYAELREFLLSRGLSFVCITEHIERLEQSDVDRIVDDCAAHSDERFVFVPGIEMDCFVVYFLGLGRVRVDFASNRSVFDSLRAAAAMCVCSHPIKANFEYPQWVIDSCDGVEVINTKYDGHHYPRAASERFYGRVRARRPRAVALAGMDFHGRSDFSPIHIRLTRQGPLSAPFVLESLSAGAFALYKGDEPLASYSSLKRTVAQARIGVMDLSHAVHRRLTTGGLRIPRGIKRALRRMMEG